MANGQIIIHLPRHFFVSVPVDLAGSSYEQATKKAYIILTKSRKGYWRLKRPIPQRSDRRDTLQVRTQ
jgi:hypothetical protein